MGIDGSGGLGFYNPNLCAWLRERAAERLQSTVDAVFRQAESERVVQRYRAVADECVAKAMKRPGG